MKFLINYLVLPKTRSKFEESYLSRMNKVAMWFFVLHVPVITLIAGLNGTGALFALVSTSAVLAGPLLAINTLQDKRSVSIVMGVSAMLMGGLLVHFGQGPIQIEMHFYFFVLLALLAVFANPMVIVAAAVTVAAHHALLWFFLPASVFNYEAPIWVVGVHALFVVLESVAACFIARSFFDNVVELESKVAARTAEVNARNRDMRMLLDAVEQGFFTIDKRGVLSDERSAAVDRLLGAPKPGETLPELLCVYDQKVADWTEMGIEEAFDGLMPIEVTIDQMPSRIEANHRTLEIKYTPVEIDGEVTALAVVVSDISAEVENEKLEVIQRELLAMINRISEDKSGFLEFFREADDIVAALRDESRDDLVLTKRRVHTLKGNTSIYGLERIADVCHQTEDYISENDQLPPEGEWATLFETWQSVCDDVHRLIGENRQGFEISDEEYAGILDDVVKRKSRGDLAVRLASWKLEPTARRLERIAEQAQKLAARLGKGNVEVVIQDNNLRIEPNQWAEFWSSFIHVIRNAIDHGVESSEDRISMGKSERGTLEISTNIEDARFIVTARDDGRGIDWDRVAALAAEKGLPNETEIDLCNALFADGLSTALSVTSTSGRGIGMAAVKSSCEALAGRIVVESQVGQGTTIRFDFPVEAMAPEATEMLLLHEIEEISDLIVDSRVRTDSAATDTIAV